MEQLIQYLIKKDYEGLEIIIDPKTIPKDDYIKLFYYTTFMNKHNLLDDEILFSLLHLLFSKYDVLHANDIIDIDDYVSHYKIDNRYRNLYRLFDIISTIEVVDMKIYEAIRNFGICTGSIRKTTNNYCQDIDSFKLIILNCKKFMGTYNDKLLDDLLYSTNKNKNQWETANSIEIMSRLINLVDYFGLDMLSLIGMKIIEVRTYHKLGFNGKVSYYRDCVNCMNNLIDQCDNLLKMRDRLVNMLAILDKA